MTRTTVTTGLLALAAACHSPKPATVAPARGPNADSIAAANAARAAAAARAEAARRDSISRADAARRDAAARADAARRAAAEAAARATLTAPIHFDLDRDEMRPEATATLDAKVPLLNAHPDLRIRIEGNADDRGSDEYNLALGQRRAAAARRYLVARGVVEGRIDVVSFGEQRPVCRGEAEPCWQQNRRDEFVIIAGTIGSSEQFPRHH